MEDRRKQVIPSRADGEGTSQLEIAATAKINAHTDGERPSKRESD
jgi:hypothetical protein